MVLINKKWFKKGFSLIEMMIVVAIIAILALIAIPTYRTYQEQSYDTLVQTDLYGFALAITFYNIDNNHFIADATQTHEFKRLKNEYGYQGHSNVFLTGYIVKLEPGKPIYFTVSGYYIDSNNVYAYDSGGGGLRKVEDAEIANYISGVTSKTDLIRNWSDISNINFIISN